MTRPRLSLPLAALGIGALVAGAAPGLAAVGNSSVPKPVPPRSAWAMTVGTTGALADAGRTATVHVDVTCPTGYKGVVVLDVVGRSTTKGSARAVGSASLTCTGATKGVDVVAAVNKKERKALKAGSAKVVAKFTSGPVDKRKGRGPGKNTTVQRTVTLG